jgi:hypothetical protein
MYAKPYIITVIKSQRIRCEERVTRRGERRSAFKIIIGKPE